MNARVLAHAIRGHNWVSLIEQWPVSMMRSPVYVVTLHVHDRADKPQTWARTDLAPDVARELYDVAVAEFISPELEP